MAILASANRNSVRRRAGFIQRHWLTALVLTACVLFVAAIGRSFVAEARVNNEVQAQKTAAVHELEIQRQRNRELRDELAHIQSQDYIEQQARTTLGYIKPGERVYTIAPDTKNN